MYTYAGRRPAHSTGAREFAWSLQNCHHNSQIPWSGVVHVGCYIQILVLFFCCVSVFRFFAGILQVFRSFAPVTQCMAALLTSANWTIFYLKHENAIAWAGARVCRASRCDWLRRGIGATCCAQHKSLRPRLLLKHLLLYLRAIRVLSTFALYTPSRSSDLFAFLHTQYLMLFNKILLVW